MKSMKFIIVAVSVVVMCLVFTSGAYGQTQKVIKTEVPPPPPPPPPPSDVPPPPPPPPVPDKDTDNGFREGAFQKVDVMPVFPGGNDALLKYVMDSVRYPKDAKEKGIQGKVVARFMVKPDGSVSDISILRGVSQSLDNESIRVLKTLPKFTPGQLNGENVAVWFAIPIEYALN